MELIGCDQLRDYGSRSGPPTGRLIILKRSWVSARSALGQGVGLTIPAEECLNRVRMEGLLSIGDFVTLLGRT